MKKNSLVFRSNDVDHLCEVILKAIEIPDEDKNNICLNAKIYLSNSNILLFQKILKILYLINMKKIAIIEIKRGLGNQLFQYNFFLEFFSDKDFIVFYNLIFQKF